MKKILPLLTITATFITCHSLAEGMAVDQADSLDFSEFHQEDTFKLIDSDKPQQPVRIGGDNKNVSTNSEQKTVTASYTNNQNKEDALLAVENLAALKCSNGWRENDQWISKQKDTFIINYQFSCR